ncbi:hypothetical protein SLEP1_g43030 [Rubroshorea leprosula]|uniref:Uncharacterized protein n=1 Tax=Rubroshorea leprosula TaxID=152421 RepID=A0AAV5LBP7_9ROSI|nr:hypothetical protein SLEP1_g43030 [Rubroshorea leprosula]
MAMVGDKTKKKSTAVTLQQFISNMTPLIDLEKEAEISASISSCASRNQEIWIMLRRGASLF